MRRTGLVFISGGGLVGERIAHGLRYLVGMDTHRSCVHTRDIQVCWCWSLAILRTKSRRGCAISNAPDFKDGYGGLILDSNMICPIDYAMVSKIATSYVWIV